MESERKNCCLAKFCFSFGPKKAVTFECWCYALASLFCEMKELAASPVLDWRSLKWRTYWSAKALLQDHGEETMDIHTRRSWEEGVSSDPQRTFTSECQKREKSEPEHDCGAFTPGQT